MKPGCSKIQAEDSVPQTSVFYAGDVAWLQRVQHVSDVYIGHHLPSRSGAQGLVVTGLWLELCLHVNKVSHSLCMGPHHILQFQALPVAMFVYFKCLSPSHVHFTQNSHLDLHNTFLKPRSQPFV